MYEYEHTQKGTFLRIVFACLAIFFFVILKVNVPQGSDLVTYGVPSIFLFCLFLFHSLTVSVSSNEIVLVFGVGLIRKSFAVTEIESAETVRCRWYQKMGIQKTWHGWSYRVSGLDAVEIRLKNGRKHKIGTDQPQELLTAVELVIDSSN